MSLYLPDSRPTSGGKVQSDTWKPRVGHGFKRIPEEERAFLRAFFAGDWERFREQCKADKFADIHEAERRWATERYQSVYRTIKGLMKGWRATKLLLEHEVPDQPPEGCTMAGLTPEERRRLVNAKFRCVAAMQGPPI